MDRGCFIIDVIVAVDLVEEQAGRGATRAERSRLCYEE
jgi:hypothetical protein